MVIGLQAPVKAPGQAAEQGSHQCVNEKNLLC